MKNIMKTALAMVLALAVLLVPMTASAALGDYDEPYELNVGGTRLAVNIPAETSVYVKASDSNGSVVNVGYATASTYFLQYGRLTTVYPNNDADHTASLTLDPAMDIFEVYNSGTAAITVYMTLAAGAPVDNLGTIDNPELLTLEDPWGMGMLSAYATKELAAGNNGYWYKVIAPDDGAINVSVNAFDADYNDIGWIYLANNVTQGKYGDNHWSDDEPVVYNEQVAVKAGDEVAIFAATYDPRNMFSNPEGNIGVSVSFSAVGSYDYPVAPVLGANAASIKNGGGYYYTYTASKDGTATVTINDATGWQFNIQGIPADPEDYGSYYYGDPHYSDDEPVVASESLEMKAGSSITVCINTYDPNNWQGPSGTVNWTFSFVAGEVSDDDDQGGNEGDEEGGNEGDEDEINYAISDTALQVGTNDYAVDATYPYTVYAFSPEETGKYTISVDGTVLGIVSYTDMWVQNTPSEDNVNADSAVWECSAVGQSIYVAVKAEAETATITVTREDLAVKEEVPWIIYENVVTPEEFVLESNFDDMMYVETFDDVVDEAVLGEDGFYHLNDAYGPILYACLSDPLMNLSDAWGYGQLKEIILDDEGNIVERTDFYYAFEEYFNCADAETGVYPLTVDLIEMFTRIGAYHNWYGEDGFIGGDVEDAWMFACYYNEGETFEPGAATTTTTTTTASDVTTTTTTSGTESPKTADVTDAMNVLFVAMLAAGVIVMAIASKKVKA